MTQILGSEGEPCDDAYYEVLNHYQGVARADERSGPCDDDCESTAPFIDGLDHESDDFPSKPLSFKGDYEWETQQAAQRWHDQGVLDSLYASDMDALFRQERRNMQAKRGQRGEDFEDHENHGYSNLYKKR
jgi:hypothetical protein